MAIRPLHDDCRQTYCSCGYDVECAIWCGPGHDDGKCPPKLDHPPARKTPMRDYCGVKAPSGDERNLWLGYHESWYHRLWWTVKKRLRK